MLNLQADSFIIDATFGRGGHTSAILASLGEQGRVLALDKDPDAIAFGRERFKYDQRVTLIHAKFSSLKNILELNEIACPVTGIIFDLGVSSPQLDQAGRGFSFSQDGPLDMRMDTTQGQSAEQWLAHIDEAELVRVLKTLGEEKFSRRIARAIVTQRRLAPITTTGQLQRLVSEAVPRREPHKHPATRTFQAIRMSVNKELDELQTTLPLALDVLQTGGRLVVISFHSLEDRIVKRFFRNMARGDDFPPDFPIPASELKPKMRLIGKARRPSPAEVKANFRARSAVLRGAEKLGSSHA